jgi:hypothetical protein
MSRMRFLQSALWVAFILTPGAALAKSDVVTVPPCREARSPAPVATAPACDESELSDYTEALSERMLSRGSRALVRVEFDEQSRVRSVCVDEQSGRATWDTRRLIAERLGEARTLPAGPRCVAGKRVDLNRYAAKLAETRFARGRCGSVSSDRMKAPLPCKDFDSDWILYDRIGAEPYLYVRSPVAEVAGVQASDTLRRCGRKAHGFEEQSACIQSEGFELLRSDSETD